MGPLKNIRVIEIAALGAAPFAGMLLADLGAEVILVDSPLPPAFPVKPKFDIMHRGKKRVTINLKDPEGKAALLKLVSTADALMEGFRPGVMERLGVGPEECMAVNEKLIYGRLTGWGQDGPLSQTAGHDINYIALSGALHTFGRRGEKPFPPLNLVGDYAGGGMLLVYGILSAIIEAKDSGTGQVVDAAMLDGAATLIGPITAGIRDVSIIFGPERGENVLDTGSHFYDTYETQDGKFMAVGAIEPHFYSLLVKGLGLDEAELPHQMDKTKWPMMQEKFTEIFKTKTRSQWCEIFEGTDACVSPVLSEDEVMDHPHNKYRKTVTYVDDFYQHNTAPRFSKSPESAPQAVAEPGTHTAELLKEIGYSQDNIAELIDNKAIG